MLETLEVSNSWRSGQDYSSTMADDERATGVNMILIDSQKGEAFTLSSGLKKLSRRLKAVYDVQR